MDSIISTPIGRNGLKSDSPEYAWSPACCDLLSERSARLVCVALRSLATRLLTDLIFPEENSRVTNTVWLLMILRNPSICTCAVMPRSTWAWALSLWSKFRVFGRCAPFGVRHCFRCLRHVSWLPWLNVCTTVYNNYYFKFSFKRMQYCRVIKPAACPLEQRAQSQLSMNEC